MDGFVFCVDNYECIRSNWYTNMPAWISTGVLQKPRFRAEGSPEHGKNYSSRWSFGIFRGPIICNFIAIQFHNICVCQHTITVEGSNNIKFNRMYMSYLSSTCWFKGPRWPQSRFSEAQYHIEALPSRTFVNRDWHDLTVFMTQNRVVIW